MKVLHRLLLILLGLTAVSAVFGADITAEAKKSFIHRLQLADRIRVGVYQEDDLNTLTRVDARGRVNLPLIGEIAIGGMTLEEAQNAIQKAYRDGRYLRNPQVTINVEEYALREVSISGQVRSPGRYSLPNESTFTLDELVIKAGGVTDIGKGDAVNVTRVQSDGTKRVFTIDVDRLIKGKNGKSKEVANTFLLEPGDIIYVPERLI